MDVDLVYLWVDGNDPQWLQKRNVFTEKKLAENSETNCKGRYANNDELRYSLRSVEKYAPFVRKIFIVTDNQTPDWLDISNPKIKIIDHREILPKEALPCFNSSVIEYFLYKIPDLSEHFLLANDDTFFNAVLTPDFFFAADSFPYVRLHQKKYGKMRYWFHIGKLGNWRRVVLSAALLVEKKFGKFYSGIPHHNIDAYKKSDYEKAMAEVFRPQVENSIPHRIRHSNDLHRSVISYYALAMGHAHLNYPTSAESCILGMNRATMKKINYINPKLLCINDNQKTTDFDRQKSKLIFEQLFPDKSAFEK